MNPKRHWMGAVLVLIYLVIFSGCSSKVNQENYRKIKIGMSYEEVVAILGEPAQCTSIIGTQSCDWGEAPRIINIKFAADNVVFRSAQGLN